VKLLRTSRREPSEAIAALTDRRNAAYERFSAGRRIVESVRRGGDPALLRSAPKLDGIASQSPLRIPEIELQLAWNRRLSRCAWR